MSDIPSDIKYAASHEWTRAGDDETVTVGISDHAQEALGDLVYVELPETGRTVDAGEACAVVESVKAASDVYAPIAGEIVEVNETLAESPEMVNQDAYGDGWLMRIKPADPDYANSLMDAAAYGAALEEEA